VAVDTIALLRGINVGGHTVTMETLRAELEALGLNEVSSVIASGNLAFHRGRRPLSTLTSDVETRLAATLGYEVATFLRTPEQLVQTLANAPWDADKGAGIGVQVGFLRAGVSAPLEDLQSGTDRLAIVGDEVFWRSTVSLARPVLNTRELDKRLGLNTYRNITTVRKLAERFS
jgi:uncharacterized protein (DUF1697 family)